MENNKINIDLELTPTVKTKLFKDLSKILNTKDLEDFISYFRPSKFLSFLCDDDIAEYLEDTTSYILIDPHFDNALECCRDSISDRELINEVNYRGLEDKINEVNYRGLEDKINDYDNYIDINAFRSNIQNKRALCDLFHTSYTISNDELIEIIKNNI